MLGFFLDHPSKALHGRVPGIRDDDVRLLPLPAEPLLMLALCLVAHLSAPPPHADETAGHTDDTRYSGPYNGCHPLIHR
ncbi:hypothetical protein, partial [Streptomyces sp. SID13588]|uniref:hypothetical protein n=1 Tax=Streptomyces sp. SID13588 TaxID=2706051 RepID=UPI001944FA42